MKKNYIAVIIKIFPDISSGRKNFDFFEWRIKKNIKLTKIYINKKTNKLLG
tara:strand:- start:186 stop:338 length:153 start_codon:yes stop_codon:yes gene_type:complete